MNSSLNTIDYKNKKWNKDKILKGRNYKIDNKLDGKHSSDMIIIDFMNKD